MGRWLMIWRLGEHYSGNIEGDEDLIVHMGLAAYEIP